MFLRRAFQISVELITEASLKKTSICVFNGGKPFAQLLRKNEFSELYFLQFFYFLSVTFLPVARKRIYIDTNNNSPIDCR